MSKGHILIVVLGEIGRSPRMRNHASSFSKEGFSVDLIGYSGTKVPNTILMDDSISLKFIPNVPQFVQFLPYICNYILKVIWHSLTLFWALLWTVIKPDYILLQNPPGLPALFIVWLICKLRRCKMITDWHNYGCSIMACSLGSSHFLVKLASWFEWFFGRLSDVNFCVTKAMKADLKANWNIKATVLYDRPTDGFHPVSLADKHNLFLKLSDQYPPFQNSDTSGNAERTALTSLQLGSDSHSYLDARPALIISSTSWTVDEDFGILFNALASYEDHCQSSSNLPDLICVITGKGPLRDQYMHQIEDCQWEHVTCLSMWLSSSDYATLLASCDLGICLHTSSSGLDLPMKVVDMFGCGLPACCVDFNCLDELVKHETNGVIFKDSNDLLAHLKDLFKDFPETPKLDTFSDNLKPFQKRRWHDEWRRQVLPLLDD